MLPTRGFALLFMITLPLCMAEVVSSAISCKLERHCYSASPYSDPDCQSYESSCCECISVIRSPHVLRLDNSTVRAGPVPHCRCTIRLRFFNENEELVVTSPTALLIPHSFYQSQYVMLRGVNTYSLPSNASLFLTDSLSLNYNAFYKIMFASYPNLHS